MGIPSLTTIGIAGALGLAALTGAVAYGDHRGAARVQFQFDTFKLAVKNVSDAEIARQKGEGEAKLAALQVRLEASDADRIAAEKAAADLQAAIAARPKVAGRGATKEDVDALNR